MYDNKKILAVVPARSGSKGIKNKNFIEIEGRPLIDYSIREALNSKFVDKVIVSTDSSIIADIAQKCGAEVPFLRPPELATDGSHVIDVILDLIKKLSADEKYDYVVLLQPTQPLRKSFHIDEAIASICDTEYNSLVSVTEVEEHPILMRKIDEKGLLKNLLNKNSTVRRQDFEKYYKVNGAIYINRINSELNSKTSLNDNQYAYIMDKMYDIDIDEEFDLEIFKLKLKKLSEKNDSIS